MSAVATTLGLARSTVTARLTPAEPRHRGRPPQRDDDLLARIKAVIADMPTYGYRRVHAILRRAAEQGDGPPAPNHKRVWRVMKQHDLLLQRHAGGEGRRHDGRIAVAERNRRWCSDGFEVGCDNGERVRVAFALDCCDREAMSFIATTGGIAGEHVRDLMVAAHGTVGNFVCGRAVAHDQAIAWVNRSPNRMANWALAMHHSRGGMIHSFSLRFKTRKSSFSAASSVGK